MDIGNVAVHLTLYALPKVVYVQEIEGPTCTCSFTLL